MTRTQPPMIERTRVAARDGKPERYHIAHGPLTISKGYVYGWPRYMVWRDRELVSGAFEQLDDAKRHADGIIAAMPRKSVMGE